MNKRGQVSTFVIVGIVVLVVVGLAISFFSGAIDNPFAAGDVQKQLEVKLEGVSNHIGKCVQTETSNAVNILAKNGGIFEPSSTLTYHATEYRILCSRMSDKEGCLNHPLMLKTMNENLENYLQEGLVKCIKLDQFAEGDITFVSGDIEVTTEINQQNIYVNVNTPVSVEKAGLKQQISSFTKIVEVPLGDITNVVNDILNSESLGISFDPLMYGVSHLGKYTIVVKKPYPNKVFYVQLTDSDYVFKFAVEGVDRFD